MEYTAFSNDGSRDHVCFFDSECGTGMGDISSPHTWVVSFYTILRVLEVDPGDPFMLPSSDGADVFAPEMAYADDQVSLSASILGLQ